MIPMLLAFSSGRGELRPTSFEILGLFAISIAALTVFILIEKRTENPVLPLDLFKNKIFTLSNVIGF